MLRFERFESLGVSTAAMTEASDGDFAIDGAFTPGHAMSLAGFEGRRVVTLRQVHGTSVRKVGAGGVVEGALESGDGLITAEPGIVIAVRAADCVPVFLYDPVVSAIGIVHCGRRGIEEGIAAVALKAMRTCFHSQYRDVHVLIGPSAGKCCYQVSEPMAAEFTARGFPAYGRYLDLWAATAQQVIGLGVPEAQVAIAGICTICDGRFHSHRRDASGCRNLALISL